MGRGPAPKPPEDRLRRNKPKPLKSYLADGKTYGKPLPRGVLPKGEDWHPQTLKWWAALRKYPLMRDAVEVDWQFLVDTALMHHQMWARGKWEFAAEIRLRVAKFGVTPEDRRRLGATIETPTSGGETVVAADGSVTSLAERRKRLAG